MRPLSTISLERLACALVDLYLNPPQDPAREQFKSEDEEQAAAFLFGAIIDFAEDFLKARNLMPK